MHTLYQIYTSYRGRDLPRGSQTRRRAGTDSQKRAAIRVARRKAKTEHPARPRQVSVYAVNGSKRPTLVYQVHFNSKLGRLITEEL